MNKIDALNKIDVLKEKVKALQEEIDALKSTKEKEGEEENLANKFAESFEPNCSLKYLAAVKDDGRGVIINILDVGYSFFLKDCNNSIQEAEKRLGRLLFNQFVSFKNLPKASSLIEFDAKISRNPEFNCGSYAVFTLDASKEFFTLLICSTICLRYKIEREEDGFSAYVDGNQSVDTFKTYEEAEISARKACLGW